MPMAHQRDRSLEFNCLKLVGAIGPVSMFAYNAVEANAASEVATTTKPRPRPAIALREIPFPGRGRHWSGPSGLGCKW